jgi:hypothetical protein
MFSLGGVGKWAVIKSFMKVAIPHSQLRFFIFIFEFKNSALVVSEA